MARTTHGASSVEPTSAPKKKVDKHGLIPDLHVTARVAMRKELDG